MYPLQFLVISDVTEGTDFQFVAGHVPQLFGKYA